MVACAEVYPHISPVTPDWRCTRGCRYTVPRPPEIDVIGVKVLAAIGRHDLLDAMLDEVVDE